MGVQKSGPSGYQTNTAAIYHLIRHGFAVFPIHRMAVLLYHVERATAYGKDSDQHSHGQAMDGIYSHTAARRDGGQGRWIRGKAGVSPTQYKRENRALLKAGLIQKITRRGKNDAHAPTEFIPDWLNIRRALEEHELQRPAPKPEPLFFPQSIPHPLGLPGPTPSASQALALGLPGPSPWASQAPTVVDLPVLESTVSESRACDPAAGQAADTHPLSWEEEHKNESAAQIAAVLENICGHPLWPNDPTPGQILADGQRQGVAALALCCFLQDKAHEFQARSYPITSPGLFVAATRTDLIAWARSHRDIIKSAASEEREAAQRARYAQTVTALPTQEELQQHGTDNSENDAQPTPHARTAGGA